jgi:hypothetical protein
MTASRSRALWPATRETPILPARTALLVVDMQNYCAQPGEGSLAKRDPDYAYYRERLETTVIPNSQRLIRAFRDNGVEVMYTVIESLTLDGRDRSLDHKHSNIHVPRGSRLGRVIDALAPGEDESVLPKSSSGVFIVEKPRRMRADASSARSGNSRRCDRLRDEQTRQARGSPGNSRSTTTSTTPPVASGSTTMSSLSWRTMGTPAPVNRSRATPRSGTFTPRLLVCGRS